MKKIFSFLIIASLFMQYSCSLSDKKEKTDKSEKPNVILFLADDMQLEYLSCYGGFIQTPNIDKLAMDGMRFERGYCSSAACTPSRFSLLTGLYASRCNHPEFLEEFPDDQQCLIGWNTPVSLDNTTIAEIFKNNGYVTGFSGKWHVGKSRKNMNLPNLITDSNPNDPEINQLIIQYQKKLQEEVLNVAGFDYAASVLWENYDQAPLKALRHHNFEWITQGAIDFLDTLKETKPFFLYVASTAIHGPNYSRSLNTDSKYTLSGIRDKPFYYHKPRNTLKYRIEERGMEFDELTIGMTQMDDQVGALIQKLKEKKLYENTTIVFLADHNREPGKATCYEAGVRVPIIIKWAGNLKTDTSIEIPVQNIDIYPTLIEACNLKTINSLKLDGKSIYPHVLDQKYEPRNNFYFEFGYTRGISDGKYKYIAFRYPDIILEEMKNQQIHEAPNHLNSRKRTHANITIKYYPGYFAQDQLYQLDTDPYEQYNLASDPAYSNKLNELKQMLDNVLITFRNPFDLETQPFLDTELYQQMVNETRKIGTDYISWWKDIVPWPPVD